MRKLNTSTSSSNSADHYTRQSGNVLVLSATFNSPNPQLRSMVSEVILRTLLTRTIAFLDDKRDISPTLAVDAEILRHVQWKLFPSVSNAPTRSPIRADSSLMSIR